MDFSSPGFKGFVFIFAVLLILLAWKFGLEGVIGD